jgi:hypothetical protein
VVAAAVAGVGGAAIAAATQTGFHATSGGFGGFGGFGGPGGPPPSAHHGDVEPDSLHGEYVVADGRGGFSTLMTQTGRITAISATSITARSDDGFSQTYVIRETDGAGRSPFAVDDRIAIDAKREGEAATVTTMRPPLSAGH